MLERSHRRLWLQLCFNLLIALGAMVLLGWAQERQPVAPAQEKTGTITNQNGIEVFVPNVVRRPKSKSKPDAGWQRIATRMNEAAVNLSEQSFGAFQKGLMPLEDHLEQLDAILTSELSTLTDQKQLPAAYQNHERRLNRVLTALRQFNQPNAIGWKSDILLTETMISQSQAWQAEARGQRSASEAARQRSVEFASQHLAQRKQDFEIGHATVPMIVNGQLVLVELAPENKFLPPDARSFLEDTLVYTRIWSDRKAGIGREDRLALAEFQQAQFELLSSLDDPRRKREAGVHAQRAEEAATRMYDSLWEFAQKGTSSLFDVTAAWRLRRRLHDILSSADQKIATSLANRRDSDLNRLADEANLVKDLTGRMSADVNFVGLMKLDAEYRKAVADATK